MTDTPTFATLDAFRAILADLPGSNETIAAAAEARNAQLTKPAGALGRLEALAIWYCGWRGDPRAHIQNPQAVVFAGNHGVVAKGVSPFPAEVTAQMVANFSAGGAAINQLCDAAGAKLTVHSLTLDRPTEDFTQAPAMTEAETVTALAIGWESVNPDADLLVCGEMGIGNTTSAAALAAALLGGSGAHWAGRGTGLDDAGVALKARVIDEGLARHGSALSDPLEALRRLGGRELAAIAGAIASARVLRIPVILDGFIGTAAAAVLEIAAPGALDHCVAGHRSAEGAHGRMLDALGMEPLLDLGLRLGEGSGAALAINILKSALACHSGMATFEEAAISGSS